MEGASGRTCMIKWKRLEGSGGVGYGDKVSTKQEMRKEGCQDMFMFIWKTLAKSFAIVSQQNYHMLQKQEILLQLHQIVQGIAYPGI